MVFSNSQCGTNCKLPARSDKYPFLWRYHLFISIISTKQDKELVSCILRSWPLSFVAVIPVIFLITHLSLLLENWMWTDLKVFLLIFFGLIPWFMSFHCCLYVFLPFIDSCVHHNWCTSLCRHMFSIWWARFSPLLTMLYTHFYN